MYYLSKEEKDAKLDVEMTVSYEGLYKRTKLCEN